MRKRFFGPLFEVEIHFCPVLPIFAPPMAQKKNNCPSGTGQELKHVDGWTGSRGWKKLLFGIKKNSKNVQNVARSVSEKFAPVAPSRCNRHWGRGGGYAPHNPRPTHATLGGGAR